VTITKDCPVVGGLLLQGFSWGSVFLIVVPVGVLILVLGPSLIPSDSPQGRHSIDLLSTLTLVSGILIGMYGLKSEFTASPTVRAVGLIVLGEWSGSRVWRTDMELIRDASRSGNRAVHALEGRLVRFLTVAGKRYVSGPVDI